MAERFFATRAGAQNYAQVHNGTLISGVLGSGKVDKYLELAKVHFEKIPELQRMYTLDTYRKKYPYAVLTADKESEVPINA